MTLTDDQAEILRKGILAAKAARVAAKEGYHQMVGELVIKWATDEEGLPGVDENGSVIDVDAFKKQFAKVLNIPDRVKRIRFVKPDDDEYIIRLPGEKLAAESRRLMESAKELTPAQRAAAPGGLYPLPGFYVKFVKSNFTDPLDLEFLESRVADYTFAHCM